MVVHKGTEDWLTSLHLPNFTISMQIKLPVMNNAQLSDGFLWKRAWKLSLWWKRVLHLFLYLTCISLFQWKRLEFVQEIEICQQLCCHACFMTALVLKLSHLKVFWERVWHFTTWTQVNADSNPRLLLQSLFYPLVQYFPTCTYVPRSISLASVKPSR